MINALRYTEELEKVGFSTEQAKRSVQIWMELMDQNFASKADFKEHYFMTKTDQIELRHEVKTQIDELRHEVKTQIDELRHDVKTQIDELRHEVKTQIDELRHEVNVIRFEMNTKFKVIDDKFDKLESRLIIKLGFMMASSIGVVSAIVGFLK